MEKAEDIISELFGVKIPEESIPVSSILKNWKNLLIDKRLPDHCRLENLNSSQLTVSFDHQGWIQVFKMHQRQILNNLNKYVPKTKITSVRMIMKADVEKYKKNSEPVQVQEKKEEKRKEIFKISNNIKDIHDDELKKHLENLKKKLQGN